MGASYYGHAATVQLLLEAGADKDAKDDVRDRKRARGLHYCGERVCEGDTSPLHFNNEMHMCAVMMRVEAALFMRLPR